MRPLQLDPHDLYLHFLLDLDFKYSSSHVVKSYKVLYSNDGVYWDEVDSGRIFKGNSDRNTHVKHWFDSPVLARSIRLEPKSWHACISLRLDFIYEC